MNELEKHSKTFEERRVIGEFLDWLGEQKIVLSAHIEDQDYLGLAQILQNRQELLDQYFRIDPVQLDKERRALLEQAKKGPTHLRPLERKSADSYK